MSEQRSIFGLDRGRPWLLVALYFVLSFGGSWAVYGEQPGKDWYYSWQSGAVRLGSALVVVAVGILLLRRDERLARRRVELLRAGGRVGEFRREWDEGLATQEDVSRHITAWHRAKEPNVPLHIWLGLTWPEYKRWVEHAELPVRSFPQYEHERREP